MLSNLHLHVMIENLAMVGEVCFGVVWHHLFGRGGEGAGAGRQAWTALIHHFPRDNLAARRWVSSSDRRHLDGGGGQFDPERVFWTWGWG